MAARRCSPPEPDGDLWVARPIELPGSRPLQFEFSQDLGSRLIEWPVDHCVKVLCFYHPDDDAALKAAQTAKLVAAFDAARKVGREILIEIIASRAGPLNDDTVARALAELYDAGLKPDWWKLEPQASVRAWEAIDQVIATRDPLCRGVVLLGLEAPIETLKESFAAARAAKTRARLRRRANDLRRGGRALAQRRNWRRGGRRRYGERSSARWSISGCRSIAESGLKGGSRRTASFARVWSDGLGKRSTAREARVGREG